MIKDTDIRIDLLDVLNVLYKRKFQFLMIFVLTLIISSSLSQFIFESKYLTRIALSPILERKVEILEKNQFINKNFASDSILNKNRVNEKVNLKVNENFDFDSENLIRVFKENLKNEKLLINTSEKFNYDAEYLFNNLELNDGLHVIFRHGKPTKEVDLLEYHISLVSDYSVNVLFHEVLDYLIRTKANLLNNFEFRDEEFRRIIMLDLNNSKKIAENLLNYSKELKIDNPLDISNYYKNVAFDNKFFSILKGTYVLEKELILINTKIQEVENMDSFELIEKYRTVHSSPETLKNKIEILDESVNKIRYLNKKISYLNSDIDLTNLKFIKYDLRYVIFRSLSKVDKFASVLFSIFVLTVFSLFFIIKDNQVKLRKSK